MFSTGNNVKAVFGTNILMKLCLLCTTLCLRTEKFFLLISLVLLNLLLNKIDAEHNCCMLFCNKKLSGSAE